MANDDRDLLSVLKFELAYLEQGGYARSSFQAWRPRFPFEDSPTCMNFNCRENPSACTTCVLAQLVPPEALSAPVPCRHIPLNEAGETLDSLYRHSDNHEIEDVLRKWLRATIAQMELRRRDSVSECVRSRPSNLESFRPNSMFEGPRTKCANPSCPHSFHWLGGGKFFRFQFHLPSPSPNAGAVESLAGPHGVKHYWLCEPCSHLFTLILDNERGVMGAPPLRPEAKQTHGDTAAPGD